MVRTDVDIQIYGTRGKCYPILKKLKEFLDGLEEENTHRDKPTLTYSMHKVIYYEDKYFGK